MNASAERVTPGPPNRIRRRLTPDDRRREILDAAIRLLRERGPGGCRVEDITAGARTAKGNFYRYFLTWDDLLVAVRDRLLDSYREELAQRYAGLTKIDWWDVVDEETDRFITFQLDLGGLHEAVFHSLAGLARPVEKDRSATSMLSWLLTAGIADGAFAAIDVDSTATLLFGVLHGAADAIASGMDREQLTRTAHRIIRRTLELDPSGNSTAGKG